MTDAAASQAETLLLVLNEPEILGVGALLGLRGRHSDNKEDILLVEAFLDSDASFSRQRRDVLFSSLPPDLPGQ